MNAPLTAVMAQEHVSDLTRAAARFNDTPSRPLWRSPDFMKFWVGQSVSKFNGAAFNGFQSTNYILATGLRTVF